ncbi:hypothetical protein SISNIDRAFT_455466 [Sistotremastrum niveocremeum HHB9708]|uniref:F-box domain-containing protein n=1 Tax=Sistotremastrum niveocremeum HHB9708 TaxID=1314777 RepID=A0A164U1X0_9AGAM|nr:hypothetical protein SISNIDRAFT_455466 [Sistotremastrum niveocremeum HHB9708]
MVQFNDLQPELCLLFMSSLSVQEIVHLAQTCSKMRELIRTHKSAFLSSTNPEIIPLPFGEITDDDVGPGESFRAAAQAVALSRRLSPVSSEDRVNVKKHSMFPLPPLSQMSPGPGKLLLDDYVVLHFSGPKDIIVLLKLSNGLSSRHQYGSIHKSSYQVVLSARKVIAALCHHSDEMGYVIQVEEYSICDANFGEVKTRFITRFDPLACVRVMSMKVDGDRILLTGRHGILYCNWVEKSALWLTSRASADFERLDACFHPGFKSISTICRRACEFVLASIKLPIALPALKDEGTAWNTSSENLRDFQWNDLEVHLKEFRQPFRMVLHPTVWVRRTPQSNHVESLIPQRNGTREAMTISHLRFNLEEGRGKNVEISDTIRPLQVTGGSMSQQIDNRLPVIIDTWENCIYILKLGDSHNLMTAWVRLQLPEKDAKFDRSPRFL